MFDRPEIEDLEKFTEILDRALQSNNPNIKDALKQLMILTVLYESPDVKKGFIGEMKQQLADTRREISSIKYDMYKSSQSWQDGRYERHAHYEPVAGRLNPETKLYKNPNKIY